MVGFGVWTQLWASWTLPLAWGFSFRRLTMGVQLAALLLAGTGAVWSAAMVWNRGRPSRGDSGVRVWSAGSSSEWPEPGMATSVVSASGKGTASPWPPSPFMGKKPPPFMHAVVMPF